MILFYLSCVFFLWSFDGRRWPFCRICRRRSYCLRSLALPASFGGLWSSAECWLFVEWESHFSFSKRTRDWIVLKSSTVLKFLLLLEIILEIVNLSYKQWIKWKIVILVFKKYNKKYVSEWVKFYMVIIFILE